MKCVTRVAPPDRTSHGWRGRCTAGGGPVESKFFADKKYGGTREAHAAAARWVLTWHAENGKPFVEGYKVVTKATNSTGVVGVYRQARDGRLVARTARRGHQPSKTLPEGSSIHRARFVRTQMLRTLLKQVTHYGA